MSEWTSVSERLPRPGHEVAILIEDRNVAIVNHPTVARLDIEFRGTKDERKVWWAGVPGNWQKLPGEGWSVTHWAELPKLPESGL